MAGVGEGIITNWDGHYRGYMAKKLPRDITMLGICGQRDRCGHYLIVVGSCGSSHFGPLLEHFVSCFVDRERSRYGGHGGN